MNSKSTEIEGTCISITGKVGNVISDRYVLNYEAPTRERSFLGMMKCQDIQGLVFFKEKMKKYILQDVYQVRGAGGGECWKSSVDNLT